MFTGAMNVGLSCGNLLETRLSGLGGHGSDVGWVQIGDVTLDSVRVRYDRFRRCRCVGGSETVSLS